MRLVRPVPVTHKYKKRAFVFKELHTCSHVFLRNMVKKALERPYTGPHRVLQRVSDRVYEIEVNGTSKNVSVELLKPAHMVFDGLVDLPPSNRGTSDGSSVTVSSLPALRTYPGKRVAFAPATKD